MTRWLNTNCRVWRMEHVCVILLLLCSTILQAADADDVVGVVGEDVVLPCSIKPTSAEDMTVTWFRGTDIVVHKYMNQRDIPDQQHPDYRGRTSLFSKEELQRGNVSLKITSLRPSDMDKYTCQILGQSGPIDTQHVQVEVEAVGSTPVITPASLNNGSVSLQCESTGWTTKPQMEWRDSRGRILPAEPIKLVELSKAYTKRVRVEKSAGPIFFCRVWTQRQTREGNITVSEHLFEKPYQGASAGLIVGIVFGGVLGLAVIIGILMFKGLLCRQWNMKNAVRNENGPLEDPAENAPLNRQP